MPFVILTAILFFVQSAFADVEATLEELRTAKNARVCQQSYAMLAMGEKRVKVEELEPNMKFNRKSGVQAFHAPSDIPRYDPTALYIGIANQEMHGNHHFYVNIGKVHA